MNLEALIFFFFFSLRTLLLFFSPQKAKASDLQPEDPNDSHTDTLLTPRTFSKFCSSNCKFMMQFWGESMTTTHLYSGKGNNRESFHQSILKKEGKNWAELGEMQREKIELRKNPNPFGGDGNYAWGNGNWNASRSKRERERHTNPSCPGNFAVEAFVKETNLWQQIFITLCVVSRC